MGYDGTGTDELVYSQSLGSRISSELWQRKVVSGRSGQSLGPERHQGQVVAIMTSTAL